MSDSAGVEFDDIDIDEIKSNKPVRPWPMSVIAHFYLFMFLQALACIVWFIIRVDSPQTNRYFHQLFNNFVIENNTHDFSRKIPDAAPIWISADIIIMAIVAIVLISMYFMVHVGKVRALLISSLFMALWIGSFFVSLFKFKYPFGITNLEFVYENTWTNSYIPSVAVLSVLLLSGLSCLGKFKSSEQDII